MKYMKPIIKWGYFFCCVVLVKFHHDFFAENRISDWLEIMTLILLLYLSAVGWNMKIKSSEKHNKKQQNSK